jgi:hypothetical protein
MEIGGIEAAGRVRAAVRVSSGRMPVVIIISGTR